MKPSLLSGIDCLLRDGHPELRDLRIGMVTNDVATTGLQPVSGSGPLAASRLALQQAGMRLVRLFAPEHGLGSDVADGGQVEDAQDPLTGVPVRSLYGTHYRPTAEMLAGLDLLLFDIPDVGVRFYTYIWTLSHVMEACAEAGLPLWVLDRPNPLSGILDLAEGPMLDDEHISTFVGRWSMPIRHSLTVGELARLWNAERGLGLELTVVPVEGLRRGDFWPATGLPFLPTSPNLPTFETSLVYPGTCLFEGTNISEGRGTSTPFRGIGAPWMDSLKVAQRFNELGLPGVLARPVAFIPTAGKYVHTTCRGVMLHVTDMEALRPVAAGLHLLAIIIRLHPQDFAWLPYRTADNAPGYGHFDRLIGRLDMRDALQALPADGSSRIQSWTSAEGWNVRVQPHLLYPS